VASGFSPLDRELELLPGDLSPRALEALVLLGTWMPFARAAECLERLVQVGISSATARRQTEAAGAAYVAVQTAAVERLEQDPPPPPLGPAVQLVSADGAMVPLVQRQWAEVRTLAVGTVRREPDAAGGLAVAGQRRGEVHARELSYFSRLVDHAAFTRQAEVELHRRGTATADVVVGVMDGAPWLQKFLDRHRPDAVRVLDFPHAVEHLTKAAEATFGGGTAVAQAWSSTQADALKHGAPSAALVALVALPVDDAVQPAKARLVRDQTFAYLEQRLGQIQYAEFIAQGYPIGSGAVESANKLLVEARLKGSGMHWERVNVNPMLALRTIVCSQRWDEAWPQICQQRRAAEMVRLAQRQARRRAAAQAAAALELPAAPPMPALPSPPPAPATSHQPLVIDGRPTAQHPWRRRFLPTRQASTAS
jgi:hypothetical protein